jgi:hypothetical protein
MLIIDNYFQPFPVCRHKEASCGRLFSFSNEKRFSRTSPKYVFVYQIQHFLSDRRQNRGEKGRANEGRKKAERHFCERSEWQKKRAP